MRHKFLFPVAWILVAFVAGFYGCGEEASSPTDGDASTDGDSGNQPDGDADGDSQPDGDLDGEPAGLSRLSADGTRLVDENGETVVLKGVNLGGWTYQETWLTAMDYSLQSRVYALGVQLGYETEITETLQEVGPQRLTGMTVVSDEQEWLEMVETALAARLGEGEAAEFMTELQAFLPDVNDDSDKPFYELLENRFGIEARDELVDAFLRAWIGEGDIQWLAEQGFNLVRVPIGYRVLTSDSHLGLPTTLTWNERSFDRLNDLLDWCEKFGVYAVIDIQECPGGQNDYSGPALLYEGEQAEAMQALTVQLWEELSDRFKDRNSVAAYSLLAEPMSAPSSDARDAMYDKLVKAIRARGDDHLLVIHDGFKGVQSLPEPEEYGWENVIYSTHLFEWAADAYDDYTSLLFFYEPLFDGAQEDQGAPYFIGSFSTIHDADWAYEGLTLFADWYNERGWSWSLWTYKCIDDPISALLWGDKSAWALRGRLQGELDRPDLFQDDLDTLRRKFAAYKDLTLDPNEELLLRLKAAL
ncbi:MAG: hypothetical protein C4523_01240 [Myxococcales bacterium]|nr:MAG: hypothetical protein C4523_01240 [Myxococcales bacterium]